MAQLEETALPALTPRSELLASLEKHNAQFTTLLSLIPAQFYIQPTQEEADSKWLKNKKRKTGEEIKENKRKNLSEKLDPSKQKTTADILFAADPSFTGMDVDTPSTSAGPSKPLTAPLPPTTSISDLRKRLAGKLAGFRSKRGIDSATGANSIAVNGGGEDVDGSEGEDEGESDDTGSRDALEAESRRRRGEMRDKRRRDRKEARRAEKAQNGSAPTGDKKKGQDVNGKARDQSLKNVPTAKTQLIVPQHSHGQTDSLTLPHIALPSGSKHGHKHTKGSIAPGTNQDGAGGDRSSHFKHLSNPAHALANLQKHDQNLASMSDDKRAEAVEQERWAKALHRAEGGKIVDSERILKKAVKRVEKNKSKSGKEWADRKKQLSDAQAAAIKKRNDNLAGRAQARKDKKSGVKKKDVKKIGGAGAKKGKSRPGFEGKKGGGGDKGKKGGK